MEPCVDYLPCMCSKKLPRPLVVTVTMYSTRCRLRWSLGTHMSCRVVLSNGHWCLAVELVTRFRSDTIAATSRSAVRLHVRNRAGLKPYKGVSTRMEVNVTQDHAVETIFQCCAIIPRRRLVQPTKPCEWRVVANSLHPTR